MNELLSVYQSLLKFSGLAANPDGYVDIVLNDSKEPCLIDGKRLVLPTDYHLRNPSPDDKTIFHPAAENILRGKSAVIQHLTKCINVKLNYSFGFIARALLELANSPAKHPDLSPEQLAGVVALGEIDDTTLRHFVTVMTTECKKHADRVFVNIYLNPGGTINGTRYGRCGITTFLFYEHLTKDDSLPANWPKLRVKDKAAFKKLCEFLLPNIQTPESYQYGSNSTTAPFLDALMKTAALVATQLNWQARLYEEHIEDPENYMFDMDWVDALSEDLRPLVSEIRAIPPQSGNEGASPSPAPAGPPPNTFQQAGYPPPGYPPQNYPVPPNPSVKVTRRGIDYESLRSAMPDLQRAPNPLQAQLWQQHVAAQQAAMYPPQAAYPQPWAAQQPPLYGYPPPPPQPGYPPQAWGPPYQSVTL